MAEAAVRLRGMTLRVLFPTALSVFALTGCATAPAELSLVPSDREIVAHVRANWDQYAARMAFLSGRPREIPALISVSKVECAPEDSGSSAECTFNVRARFGDGAAMTRSVDSRYVRLSNGSLQKLIPVVVVYH